MPDPKLLIQILVKQRNDAQDRAALLEAELVETRAALREATKDTTTATAEAPTE